MSVETSKDALPWRLTGATLGGDDSTYAHHMKDSRFTIPTPALLAKVVALTAEDHKQNNLPDILARWRSISNLKSEISNAERVRLRIAQSFCVPKADIAAQGYDLSLNRYKEVVHENVTHRKPDEILKALDELEKEIQQGMKELKEMLK